MRSREEQRERAEKIIGIDGKLQRMFSACRDYTVPRPIQYDTITFHRLQIQRNPIRLQGPRPRFVATAVFLVCLVKLIIAVIMMCPDLGSFVRIRLFFPRKSSPLPQICQSASQSLTFAKNQIITQNRQ